MAANYEYGLFKGCGCMAGIEIIRVEARPPFLRFRPGIDRSRRSPFTGKAGGFEYISFLTAIVINTSDIPLANGGLWSM